MSGRKTIVFFVFIACLGVALSGCQTASDSVDKTDKWMDEELHKHM